MGAGDNLPLPDPASASVLVWAGGDGGPERGHSWTGLFAEPGLCIFAASPPFPSVSRSAPLGVEAVCVCGGGREPQPQVGS